MLGSSSARHRGRVGCEKHQLVNSSEFAVGHVPEPGALLRMSQEAQEKTLANLAAQEPVRIMGLTPPKPLRRRAKSLSYPGGGVLPTSRVRSDVGYPTPALDGAAEPLRQQHLNLCDSGQKESRKEALEVPLFQLMNSREVATQVQSEDLPLEPPQHFDVRNKDRKNGSRSNDIARNGTFEGMKIGPALSGLGVPQKQTSYVEQTLHPLFADMVLEAVRALPAEPALFCLRWLLAHLLVPDFATKPLWDWVERSGKAAADIVTDAGDAASSPEDAQRGLTRNRDVGCGGGGGVCGGGRRGSRFGGTVEKPSETPSGATAGAEGSSSRGFSTVAWQCPGDRRPPSPELEDVSPPVNTSLAARRRVMSPDSVCSTDGSPSSQRKLEPARRPSILKKPGSLSSTKDSGKKDRASITHQLIPETSNEQAPSSAVSRVSSTSPRRTRRRSTLTKVHSVQMAPDKVFGLLSKVPVLGELEDKDRRLLVNSCIVRRFEADSEVLRHGDYHNEIFIVAEGQVRVSVPQLMNTLQPGDSYGGGVLLKGEMPAEANLSAAPDNEVTLVCLAAKDFNDLGFCCKNILRRNRKSSMSRYVAHPETAEARRAGNSSPTAAPFGSRGRSCTGVPKYEESHEVCKKSQLDSDFIKSAVRRNQHLSDLLQLSDAQVDEMARGMSLLSVEANSLIIQKGDPGDKFFVIHDGLVQALLDPDPENPTTNRNGTTPVMLHTGDSFGELALLYDSPRKASVVTVRASMFWVLELRQWRNVLKKVPASRIDEYQGLLFNIPKLCAKVQDIVTRRQVANSLEEVYYLAGEVVVTEGDIGLAMYIIFDGTCTLTQDGEVERKLTKGEWFGQESLFECEPYSVTVAVESETATILALDRVTLEILHVDLSSKTGGMVSLVSSQESGKVSRRRSILAQATQNGDNTLHHPSSPSNKFDANKALYPRERLKRIGILGTGSFALVSLEQDPVSQRFFALKAMSKKIVVDKSLKNMVLGERKAYYATDSIFVTTLVTTFQDSRCIYFLMEAALGGELFDLYSERSGWFGREDLAIFFVICVSIGLEHMHSKKLIHRDIKLENILLTVKGYARITDLGLAKIVIGKTYTVCGSADYLAPETLRQAGHNRAVDWWAVGILTFCVMSGRMPFDAEDVMQSYKNIVKGFRKEHFPSAFSTNLVDFVKGLCQKKPLERIPMLPGGVGNLAAHPWLDNAGNAKWKAIEEHTFIPPHVPAERTVEELKVTLRKTASEVEFEEYVDDGTGWDKDF